jgi:transposase-like protein
MSATNDEVVALYKDQGLTMQAIGDRLGITKSRVHQILRAAGVTTGYRYQPRPDPEQTADKAYRAYRLSRETRELVERLAEATGASRTAVVTRAVEELAAKVLPAGGGGRKRPGRKTGG